jgi:hypothetical protein
MARHIVCLSFDFDVWSGFVARGMATPTLVSRGEFGLVGAGRILALLERYGIRATWFVPGVIVASYPESARGWPRRATRSAITAGATCRRRR